jgi:hypothetical protein
LAEPSLLKHVNDSSELLSQILCYMIEAKKVFTTEEIERNTLE